MWKVLPLGLLGMFIACGRGGDKCTRAYEKIAPAYEAATKTKPDRDKQVAECHDGLKKHPESEAMLDCILAIDGEVTNDKVTACNRAESKARHAHNHDDPTPDLDAIGQKAKQVHDATGKFPEGKVGRTPAGDPTMGCCISKDNKFKCPSTAKDWTDPVWKALGFEIDEDTFFRFTYESDGKTFTATAAADIDCDTELAIYTLTGAADGTLTQTKPAPGKY